MNKRYAAALAAVLNKAVPDTLGNNDSLDDVVVLPDIGETTKLDLLADTRPDPENAFATRQEHMQRLALLSDALRELEPHERDLLFMRRLAERPLSLGKIAAGWSTTKREVLAAEIQAIRKLKQIILTAEAEIEKRRQASAARPKAKTSSGTAFTIIKLPQ